MERPAAAAALDDPTAGTRASRPAEPARGRGRSWRAVRRRPRGHGRRAGAGHAESAAALRVRPNPADRDHAAPRGTLAAFEGAAPERSGGRASRRGEAPGSDPDPRHVVQTGAGSVAARAHDAAGPGTGTELLIDTRDDSDGSCPPPARARSSPPAGGGDRRQGFAPTSGDPARWGAQRGGSRAGTIDPSCDPTPCPSAPVHPAACLRQAAGAGESRRAMRAFSFCGAVRRNDEHPGRQGAATNLPRERRTR